MKTIILPLVLLLIAGFTKVTGQNIFPSNGAAGIGTLSPDSSSLLEIKSTSRGLLIPRMSKTQRDLISSPATGLMIYQNNSTPGFYYYTGTAWASVTPKSANTALSNLIAPTAVNTDLLPSGNGLLSLGSSSQYWRNVYVSNLNFVNGTTQTTAFTPYTPGTGISISGTAVSLANSGVTASTYGSASAIPVITVDVTGRITSATTAPAATGANTTLSNLSSTTSINRSLIPVGGNVIDLGASGSAWRDIYLSGKLYFGTTRFMHNTGSASTFVGNNSGNLTATGTNNTAVGAPSGFSLSSGHHNSFFGDSSGYANSIGYNNTFFGSSAGKSNTTGNNNMFIGSYAGYNNETGVQNVGLGANALANNKTGAYNTANGYDALFTNTTGANNTATGSYALYNNSDGHYNTATGFYALYANTIGNWNTASGYSAFANNRIASYNTATGCFALQHHTSGDFNTAYGYGALLNDSIGNSNTASGYNALFQNITGSSNTASGYNSLTKDKFGNSNVAVGVFALYNDTSSSNLVAVGDSALFNLVNGSQSVAVGSKAGYTTKGSSNSYFGYHAGFADNASNNTAVGTLAGWTVANGNSCTYLGSSAGPTTAGFTNATGIGYNVTPTASNQVRIGNGAVTSIGGQVGWTTLSDGRFKRNFKDNVPGLAFINLIKPVTYTLDIKSLQKFTGEDEKEKGEDHKSSSEISKQEKIIHTGFVAQDVEAVAKKLNYDFDGVDAPKNDKDPYGIRYAEFVVPLVKAVQELSKTNDEKDTRIENLQQQIDELKAMVLKGAQSNTASEAVIKTTLTSASLEQNIPNPFTNTTSIHYTLPENCKEARVIVTDKTGKTLQTINVTGKNTATIQLDASTLAAGAYQYSLLINNKLIATRQMILAR